MDALAQFRKGNYYFIEHENNNTSMVTKAVKRPIYQVVLDYVPGILKSLSEDPLVFHGQNLRIEFILKKPFLRSMGRNSHDRRLH